MSIKVSYDVAGIVPEKNEGMSKYGGPMVMQQQKYDQEARLQQGAQGNAMQRLMANPKYMEQMNQRAMIDTIRQDVANGMYDAADANQINGLLGTMSAANSGYLDESQRNQATSAAVARLAGITSNARQPVQNAAMQPPKMPPAPRNPQEAWAANGKMAQDYFEKALAGIMESGETITPESRQNAWRIARENFDIDYRARTGYVDPQPQGQVDPGGQQPMAPGMQVRMLPEQRSAGSGRLLYSTDPTMQGQMPGAMPSQSVSFADEKVFGVPDVLAMPASPPLPGVATGAVLPGAPAQPPATPPQPTMTPQQTGMPQRVYRQSEPRTWTSNDGQYTTKGSFLGFAPNPSADGSRLVYIRKEDGGKVVPVPLGRLSSEDLSFLDTQYSLQNPDMTAVQAYFDVNNPVYSQMRSADQSIVNPQKRTMGEPGGEYGLGQVNYGQSPSGQNVYADIIPGGTMPVARSSSGGRTPEERALDAKRMKDFRSKQSKMTSGAQAPAAATTPALTQLLATMTPSQRRDFSKWLGEEPSRYGNRNEIAAQQATEWGDEVSQGKYQKYPGMQARKQKQQPGQGQQLPQGQQSMQSQSPRQPLTAREAFAQNGKLEREFMGMVAPNADGSEKPYEQKLREAMEMYDTRQRMLFGQPQGQQPMQGQQLPQGQQPPQAEPLVRTDPRVKAAEAVAMDPNAPEDQQKIAIKTLLDAGFSPGEVESLTKGNTQGGVASPPVASQPVAVANQPGSPRSPQGSKANPSPAVPLEIRQAESIIKNGGATDFQKRQASKVLRNYGYTDSDIRNLLPSGGPTGSVLQETKIMEEEDKAYTEPQSPEPQSPKPQSPKYQPTPNEFLMPQNRPAGSVSQEAKITEEEDKIYTDQQLPGPQSPKYPSIPNKPLMSQNRNPSQSAAASSEPPQNADETAEESVNDLGFGRVRTWTDKRGRNFQGSLIEGSAEAAAAQNADNRMVTVRSVDGRTRNIPVSELSEDDLAYLDAVYAVQMGNPTRGENISKGKPFKYKRMKTPEKQGSEPEKGSPAPVPSSWLREVYKNPPSSGGSVVRRTS